MSQASNPIYTSEYSIWRGMIQRCTNKKNLNYYNYGGRGIIVCDKWKKNFMNFFKDMGRRPSLQHSIDRINNNGNYEPGNCRWATMKEQASNKRPRKKHPSGLSQMQRMVLHELCTGKSNKELATTFSISERTVKTHLVRIYMKINVTSCRQAIVKGLTNKSLFFDHDMP